MNELYIKKEDETKVKKQEIEKLANEKYKSLAGMAQQYLFYWKRETAWVWEEMKKGRSYSALFLKTKENKRKCKKKYWKIIFIEVLNQQKQNQSNKVLNEPNLHFENWKNYAIIPIDGALF